MIPGLSQRRQFKDLSEQEVLALAISSEEDDGRIYRWYAQRLRADFPQSAKAFEEMADEEEQHRSRLIDEHRRLSFVNYGEVVTSHAQAVEFIRDYARVAVPRRFKTVVTSAAGYPLDKTYYQTVKGMVGPLDILEPGGDLIIASACSEGMGSKHYVEAQRRLVELGAEGFWSSIEPKPHADIDEWQTQMQLKPMRVGRVRLFTDGLNEVEAGLTGVEHIDDVAAAVADSMQRHGDDQVAFVPEGPYVVPVHAP